MTTVATQTVSCANDPSDVKSTITFYHHNSNISSSCSDTSEASTIDDLDDSDKSASENSDSSQQLSAKALLSSSSSSSSNKQHDEKSKDDLEDEEEEEGCCTKFTSCRWVVGYLCCAARFCQSAIRQCIGMAVVCMTLRSEGKVGHPTTPSPFSDGGEGFNNSSIHSPDYHGDKIQFSKFNWTPEFEGLVLNAFNFGFFFSPILGGYIAGTFGGKRVVLAALLAGSISTICLPIAANYNDLFVVLLRAVAGTFLGVVDPSIQALWAKWAPKKEKAKLTTCSYTGLSLAGIVTFLISGELCGIDIQNGWPFIFYFFGGFALLCSVPWMFLVYDSPDDHPRILDYEKRLINKGKGHASANKKLRTPWKSMLTSGPFWAIIAAHMSYTWVTSWMMAYIPKYLSDIMRFDVDEDGLYSSLPYVGRLLSGILASYLSDKVTHSGRLSTGRTRKLFQTVGCVGCAACTLAVGFLDHTMRGVAVVLLVLAMSFQNLTSVAFRINHLDIAPRFAGVMMGMTVTGAMAFSLTGPPITAAIVKDGTRTEWMGLFIIVAVLNIIGAAVFEILGSGEVQEWAQPPKTEYTAMSVVTITNVDILHPPSRDDKPNGNIGKAGMTYVNIADSTSSVCHTDSEEDSDHKVWSSSPVADTRSNDSAFVCNKNEDKADLPTKNEENVYENGNDFCPASSNTLEYPQTQAESMLIISKGKVPNGTFPSGITHNGTAPSGKVHDGMALNATAHKHNRLRKRMSLSDIQQGVEGKVKQVASTQPSLPRYAD